jgi:hypothetical protein
LFYQLTAPTPHTSGGSQEIACAAGLDADMKLIPSLYGWTP